MKKCLGILLIFIPVLWLACFSVNCDEINYQDQIAKSKVKSAPQTTTKQNQKKPSLSSKQENSKAYFSPAKNIQEAISAFFQLNAGVGFLYFSDIRGNTYVKYQTPGLPVPSMPPYGSNYIRGPISYNRTPVFELLLGYRFNQWFKTAFSYLHQGNVTIQTSSIQELGAQSFYRNGLSYAKLNASLCLDALLLKVYFELPYPLIWKKAVFFPYLSAGAGTSWQSWINVELEQTFTAFNDYVSEPLYLRNKIIPNVAWMVDMGLRLQSAYPDHSLSVLLGCKFMDWGQVRNLGKISQQGTVKRGFTHPFKSRMLYSFIPYIGFQWDIDGGNALTSNFLIQKRSPNTWKAFIAHAQDIQSQNSLWANINAGPGFLYFSGPRGDTFVKYEKTVYTNLNKELYGNNQIRGPISYNRTPAVEALLGYRFNQWFKTAVSYLHQGNIAIQTPMILGLGSLPNSAAPASTYSQLRSNLSLDAILLKVYGELPYLLVLKGVGFSPYLAAGIGSGWQSWMNTELGQTYMFSSSLLSNPLALRNKMIANVVWMFDLGMRVQSVYPDHFFSVLFGCKFIDWGQVRNIGKYSQQANVKRGLTQPFKIKSVYSFIPYIGFQWDIPSGDIKPPQMIKGRHVNRWRPFIVPACYLQTPHSFWTNLNVGPGFLYFFNVRGNTFVQYENTTVTVTNKNIYGENTIKGPLCYNRTPVLEALLGYRFNQWFKAAFSYLHQGGIFIQTPMIQGLEASPASIEVGSNFSQLRSNLNLDAILFKVYLEFPYPMICKGIAFFPYLAAGVGSGWQSWTNIRLEQSYIAFDYFTSGNMPFRNKIVVNAVCMGDCGFRLRSATQNSTFSVLLGCKFMDWGQTRNIAEYNQQSNVKRGFPKPLIVKMIYSFIPYMGLQWDF